MNEKITLTLKFSTQFCDFNRANGLPENHLLQQLEVAHMKYAHIREMQNIPPELQMDWMIKRLTGLSDQDLGELYAEDAAALSEIVLNFIEKYFEIAHKINQ